ncbi:hypothetical protein KIPB_004049 [Kipferlia bialata]|uniref:Uncharacterized protein n=1 Tax=Kipferlia bialata TaxID=797122 RepID=A0A9K3CUF5_9EUKA|nr:hypothetical protein KIPB_004049 [Kipferlia bialata]|eukprot:g4049.t1
MVSGFRRTVKEGRRRQKEVEDEREAGRCKGKDVGIQVCVLLSRKAPERQGDVEMIDLTQEERERERADESSPINASPVRSDGREGESPTVSGSAADTVGKRRPVTALEAPAAKRERQPERVQKRGRERSRTKAEGSKPFGGKGVVFCTLCNNAVQADRYRRHVRLCTKQQQQQQQRQGVSSTTAHSPDSSPSCLEVGAGGDIQRKGARTQGGGGVGSPIEFPGSASNSPKGERERKRERQRDKDSVHHAGHSLYLNPFAGRSAGTGVATAAFDLLKGGAVQTSPSPDHPPVSHPGHMGSLLYKGISLKDMRQRLLSLAFTTQELKGVKKQDMIDMHRSYVLRYNSLAVDPAELQRSDLLRHVARSILSERARDRQGGRRHTPTSDTKERERERQRDKGSESVPESPRSKRERERDSGTGDEFSTYQELVLRSMARLDMAAMHVIARHWPPHIRAKLSGMVAVNMSQEISEGEGAGGEEESETQTDVLDRDSPIVDSDGGAQEEAATPSAQHTLAEPSPPAHCEAEGEEGGDSPSSVSPPPLPPSPPTDDETEGGGQLPRSVLSPYQRRPQPVRPGFSQPYGDPTIEESSDDFGGVMILTDGESEG